jgi:hypothetical protein
MLGRLLVAMVALGLASTTWHGIAVAASHAPAMQANATQVGHEHGGHSQADHKHPAPGKTQAAAQTCCHPACTMAVIPFPTGPMQEFPLSAPLHVTGDSIPVPESPSGPDRPPKTS